MYWKGFWLSLVGLLMIGNATWAQLPAVCKYYDRAADSLILDSLRLAYGQSKIIPPSIELQALRALSHYPELKTIALEFRFCKQTTAHSSQPMLKTILHRSQKRSYLVKVSIEVPEFYFLGMQANLPYNAQIGVLGHELAHSIQYLRKRFGGLIGEGLRYALSKKHVIAVEHQTDQYAIDHHLGYQLLAWQQIARPLLEQAGRGQNYMRPDEIEAQLSK